MKLVWRILLLLAAIIAFILTISGAMAETHLEEYKTTIYLRDGEDYTHTFLVYSDGVLEDLSIVKNLHPDYEDYESYITTITTERKANNIILVNLYFSKDTPRVIGFHRELLSIDGKYYNLGIHDQTAFVNGLTKFFGKEFHIWKITIRLYLAAIFIIILVAILSIIMRVKRIVGN